MVLVDRAAAQSASAAIDQMRDAALRRCTRCDPGVRIAYVGGQSQAIAKMQLYWQSRGAISMHCALDANGRPAGLSFGLKRADVAFHSLEDISAQTRRYLMPSCERHLLKVPWQAPGTRSGLVARWPSSCGPRTRHHRGQGTNHTLLACLHCTDQSGGGVSRPLIDCTISAACSRAQFPGHPTSGDR